MTPSYLDLAYRTLAPENPARQAFQTLDPNQDGVLTGEERAGLDGAGRARTTALTAELPIRDLLAVVGKSDTAKKSWLGVNDRNTFFQDTAEALGWTASEAKKMLRPKTYYRLYRWRRVREGIDAICRVTGSNHVQLANLLGVEEAQLSRWYNGKTEPDRRHREKLEKALASAGFLREGERLW